MKNVKWIADLKHSEVQFKVKHMMVNNVSGYFNKFDITLESENDEFENAKVHFTADVSSISTNDEERDTHLKSADFLDAETFPNIIFESTEFRKVADDEYELSGSLIIKAVSHPIRFKVEFGGAMVDPWGNKKAGFSITGKIHRKDFGLKWNAALEAGGVLVSDEVKLIAEVQLEKIVHPN